MVREISRETTKQPSVLDTQPRATLFNPECLNMPWMRIALIIQFLLAFGLLMFFILYSAGVFPLENFTGSIGPVTTIFGGIVLTIGTGTALYIYKKIG